MYKRRNNILKLRYGLVKIEIDPNKSIVQKFSGYAREYSWFRIDTQNYQFTLGLGFKYYINLHW